MKKRYGKGNEKMLATVDYLRNEFLNIFNNDNLYAFWESGWKIIEQERNSSRIPYKGINAIYLSLVASKNEYEDNRWFTSAQISNMNEKDKDVQTEKKFIHIKKGERASYVEYPFNYLVRGKLTKDEFEALLKKANDAIGRNYKTKNGYYNNTFTFDQLRKIIDKTDLKSTNFWIDYKNYPVFNGDQIEGIDKPEILNTLDYDKIRLADMLMETYMKNENIGIFYRYNETPGYLKAIDKIVMPPKGTFLDEEYYISTLVHEVCHSTGTKNRLDRKELAEYTKDSNRAIEEMNVEIAATLFCNELGVEMDKEHIDNHLIYVKEWSDDIAGEKGDSILRSSINKAYQIIEYVKEKGEYNKIVQYCSLDKNILEFMDAIKEEGWHFDFRFDDSNSTIMHLALSMNDDNKKKMNDNDIKQYDVRTDLPEYFFKDVLDMTGDKLESLKSDASMDKEALKNITDSLNMLNELADVYFNKGKDNHNKQENINMTENKNIMKETPDNGEINIA